MYIEKFDELKNKRIRKAVGAIIVTPEDKFLLIHKSKICDGKEGKIDVGFWDKNKVLDKLSQAETKEF